MGRWHPLVFFFLLLSSLPSLQPQHREPIKPFFPSEAEISSARKRQRTVRGADDVVVAIRDVKPAAATATERQQEDADAAGAGTAARRDTAALALSAMMCCSLLFGRIGEKTSAQERKRGASRNFLNAKKKKSERRQSRGGFIFSRPKLERSHFFGLCFGFASG